MKWNTHLLLDRLVSLLQPDDRVERQHMRPQSKSRLLAVWLLTSIRPTGTVPNILKSRFAAALCNTGGRHRLLSDDIRPGSFGNL